MAGAVPDDHQKRDESGPGLAADRAGGGRVVSFGIDDESDLDELGAGDGGHAVDERNFELHAAAHESGAVLPAATILTDFELFLAGFVFNL